MKKTLFATVIALVALITVNLRAQGAGAADLAGAHDNARPDTGASEKGDISRRYRWQNGCWWYWMPEKQWLVWTGTSWAPHGQVTGRAGDNVGSYSASYGSYQRQGDAGYGWTWGPGTAYHSAPGSIW
jgi:hypothetical protein